MAITAADVNKLRKMTGVGMMDCKKALTEAEGDFDAAVDILRKRGQKIASKRADREATEGAAIAKTSDDYKYGVVIRLGCETDFVAKNEDFVEFANEIADAALAERPADMEALLQVKLGDLTVAQKVDENVAKLGEKIEVNGYEATEGETVVAYNHMGNRVGVIVAMNQAGKDEIATAAKNLAMQVAAMNPLAVNADEITQEVKDRELEVAKDQMRAEGKPEEMIEKIAMGKLNKYFKENTLLGQSYVKDPSMTVEKMLKNIDNNLTVTAFRRLAVS